MPITCKTCNSGQLVAKKTYRMSGAVVFIGYVILIPSLMGLAFCFFMLLVSGGGVASMGTAKEKARQNLTAVAVPPATIEHVLNAQAISPSEQNLLTSDQARAIRDAQKELAVGAVGTGLGILTGGASVCLSVSFLLFSLFGWLLVMKNKVLQCDSCSAVIAAS